MILDRVYFGAWLPRTMIHLEEVYDFLKFGRGPQELHQEKIRKFYEALAATDVAFVDNADYNIIAATCDGVRLTITEDGVIMLDAKIEDVTRDTRRIEQLYAGRLGPALAYLFSRGAPLPVSLAQVEEIYPRIVVGRHITDAHVRTLFGAIGDTMLTTRISNGYRVAFGHFSEVIDVRAVKHAALPLQDLMCQTIFIRGFSQLLQHYLAVHRSTWTDITRVRDSEIIRHKDFTKLRMHILDTLATISFVQARMKQMGNILHARERITSPSVQQLLHTLGFVRYEALEATLDYTKNLWQMTADYVNDTMSLLESVLQENSQRELRILQLATVAGVVVGFFGMNIAFPWDSAWHEKSLSSLVVTGLVILGVGLFYVLIRIMILNRRFVINREQHHK